MITFFRNQFFLLSFILIIALFLRLCQLDTTPTGFLEDEAHIGYNAYSILQTGKDKNNDRLSLSVDQFGDFRPSGLHNLVIPSVAFFDLTIFATRFPVALVGGLSVVIMYFLAFEIFKKRELALLASAMLALNPWHISASRITSESIVALALVMLGVWGFLKFIAVPEKKIKKNVLILLLGVIAFIVSFQFYHASRYFVPFLLSAIILFTVFKKSYTLKQRSLFFLCGVITAIGLVILFILSSGQGRVDSVSIFTHPETQIQSHMQKIEDTNIPSLLVHLFHNPITEYGRTFVTNYGQHFNSDFLFVTGGYPIRYMIPWQGLFYGIDVLFLVIGVAAIVIAILSSKERSFLLFLPLLWTLLGPIPAAFTFEDIPHYQRSIMMLPGLILLAAYGCYYLFASLSHIRIRQGVIIITALVFTYNFATFLHTYFHHGQTHQTKYRSEGLKELVAAVGELKDDGREIIMTSQYSNHVIFYLFYDKIDPDRYQQLGSPRDKNNLEFEGYTFRDEDCPSYSAGAQVNSGLLSPVYVDLGNCLIPAEIRVIKEILRPDQSVAFRILEVKE